MCRPLKNLPNWRTISPRPNRLQVLMTDCSAVKENCNVLRFKNAEFEEG